MKDNCLRMKELTLEFVSSSVCLILLRFFVWFFFFWGGEVYNNFFKNILNTRTERLKLKVEFVNFYSILVYSNITVAEFVNF